MIIFLDLETTGLDPQKCKILEVAARVWPDAFGLNTFERVIQLQPGDYQSADEFVQNMHTESGLWTSCANAGCSVADAAVALERWLMGLRTVDKALPTLAGNSIHFDRSFLKVHMPYVERMFHYRMLDVSSLHIAAEALGLLRAPKPEKIAHRAMDDVLDSIRQFEHYRRYAEKLETP